MKNARQHLIWVLMGLVTLVLYWPVRLHEFVNYDDQLYLTQHYRVQAGLTADNVRWAFSHLVGNGTYWHPLTWLSHLLDIELFGMNAGRHHLVSLGIHLANVLLVFRLLRRLEAGLWTAALVAALFAWHPLQVDTVAWAAERKNVLSTLFFLLALLAYVGYAQAAGQGRGRWGRYALAVLAFAAGLMCKPMLVTLPCVLLLLDAGVLGRVSSSKFQAASGEVDGSGGGRLRVWGRLLLEKAPFFVLAGASSVITLLGHQKLGILMTVEQRPLLVRVANSVVSYGLYLKKTLWPMDLSVYYPPGPPAEAGVILLAGLALAGLTFLVWRMRRTAPLMLVGWLWFLGTLVPVIGLVQVNDQAMADRFAYVPVIGLFLMLAEGARVACERWKMPVAGRAVLAAVVLGACLVLARQQLACWRNSETLFQHASEVTPNNNVAHINLGAVFEARGEFEKAEAHYAKAVAIVPNNPIAQGNLGVVRARQGRLDEAMACFTNALRIEPGNADALCNLGLAFSFKKQFDESVRQYEEALRQKPDHLNAHLNLGNVLNRQGRFAEAAPHFQAVLRLTPGNAEAHFGLANALVKLDRIPEAVPHYQETLRLDPGHAAARQNLERIAK